MMQIDFFQSIISNCISDYHLSSSFIHSVLIHTYGFLLVGFKFSRLTFPQLLYQLFRYESVTLTLFFLGGVGKVGKIIHIYKSWNFSHRLQDGSN